MPCRKVVQRRLSLKRLRVSYPTAEPHSAAFRIVKGVCCLWLSLEAPSPLGRLICSGSATLNPDSSCAPLTLALSTNYLTGLPRPLQCPAHAPLRWLQIVLRYNAHYANYTRTIILLRVAFPNFVRVDVRCTFSLQTFLISARSANTTIKKVFSIYCSCRDAQKLFFTSRSDNCNFVSLHFVLFCFTSFHFTSLRFVLTSFRHLCKCVSLRLRSARLTPLALSRLR